MWEQFRVVYNSNDKDVLETAYTVHNLYASLVFFIKRYLDRYSNWQQIVTMLREKYGSISRHQLVCVTQRVYTFDPVSNLIEIYG